MLVAVQAIGAGIVSSTGVEKGEATVWQSAPDDHFSAGPHGCVATARVGRADDADGGPTVGGRIVSAAGV